MSNHEIEVMNSMMKGDDDGLIFHAEKAPSKAALSAILGRLNSLYRNSPANPKVAVEHAPLAQRLPEVGEGVRRRAGAAQRDVDLHLMQVILHSVALCAVIGTGATMDAGGPSWSGPMPYERASGKEIAQRSRV